MPPRLMTAVSLVPPPMSMTMLPTGSSIGRSAPIAAAIGCSIRLASAAPARRAASVTARRSTSVIADGTQMTTLGRVKRLTPTRWSSSRIIRSVISKSVIAPPRKRSDGDDVAGRAPDHLPRLPTGGEHLAGLTIERDDRRLVEHDAAALHVDERVGGPEVDRQVTRHGHLLVAVGRRLPRGRSPFGVAIGDGLSSDRTSGGEPPGRERVDLAAERIDALVWRRLRLATTTTNTAVATTTTHRRWPRSGRRSADRHVGVDTARRVGAPIGAVAPHLVLPDRHRYLQRVDREPSGLERLGPVRRRDDGDDRALAQFEAARRGAAAPVAPTSGQRRRTSAAISAILGTTFSS